MTDLEIKDFRDKYNLTQKKLADIVSTSVRAVQSWEQGTRNMPQSAVRLIELYKEQREDLSRYDAVGYLSGVGIKLYDIEASGGFGTFESMISEDKVIGEYVIPAFSSADWLMYVKGSSMYPKYSSGDIIACKQLKESKFLQWNKVYVLATKEQGLLVKRLMPSELENSLRVVSDNKDYPAFDIPKNEILGIALVLGVIRLE